MAHCPACGRTIQVGKVLQLKPREAYRCGPCGAESTVDAGRFRLAAAACAYLTVLVPVGAYAVARRLCPTAAAFVLWAVLSPYVFSSWTVFRLSTHAPQGSVPPPRLVGTAPPTAGEAGP